MVQVQPPRSEEAIEPLDSVVDEELLLEFAPPLVLVPFVPVAELSVERLPWLVLVELPLEVEPVVTPGVVAAPVLDMFDMLEVLVLAVPPLDALVLPVVVRPHAPVALSRPRKRTTSP